MDIVQGDSGRPLSPWTLSSLGGLPGLCPQYPWTFPDYPLIPWTMSREPMDSLDILPMGYFTEISVKYPVCKMPIESMGSLDNMSMDSLDIVHGIGG